MSYFLWENGMIWNIEKQKYSRKRLRKYINDMGLYTKDQRYHTIFGWIYYLSGTDDRIFLDIHIIDVIFEFKPDLRFICGNAIYNCQYLQSCDYYVMEKFMEHDTDYAYIRYPFRYWNQFTKFQTYPNFMWFLSHYQENISIFPSDVYRFLDLFKSHFYRGITFFELMYFRFEKPFFY